MAKLIPLAHISHRARGAEAHARAKWPTRAMALDAATIAIIAAPGCYGGAEPPIYGFVLTLVAAVSLSSVKTSMPDGSSHRRLHFYNGYASSTELSEYVDAVARGMPIADALAIYNNRRMS